ncbi:MAG: hypothetical protein P8Y70_17060 [Candidatus Lokiarchaeota archaeon]
MSTPSTIEGLKAASSSFHLFGTDKQLLGSIISEKVANKLNKPLLLLLFIKKQYKEEDIAKPLLLFINDVLDEIDIE